MARFRFIAPGHTGHVCKIFGHEFPHMEWVDAPGLTKVQAKTLAANPTFESDDAADRKAAVAAAKAAAKGGASGGAPGPTPPEGDAPPAETA